MKLVSMPSISGDTLVLVAHRIPISAIKLDSREEIKQFYDFDDLITLIINFNNPVKELKMISSTVANPSAPKREVLRFPVLVKHTGSGLVVLLQGDGFPGKYAGTVMVSDTPDYPVGYYSKSWWKAYFNKFDGQVSLCNDE